MPTDDLLAPARVGPLDHLVAAALRNKLLVAIGLVLLLGVGGYCAWRLPVDAVPDVTNVQVQVLTDVAGLSPVEVERFVSSPVESAMAGLPHTEEVRSLSRFGLSVVTVVFADGTDPWWARQLVGERLAAARGALPDGVEPELGPASTGLGEIFQFEVRGDARHSLMDLRDVLEWQIAPRLRAVPGVVEVNPFGGELRTYEVAARPERLAAHGLVLADLFEALERNNLTVGGGYLVRGREQVLVRGTGLIESLDDLGRVVVDTTEDGKPVTVAMIGEARFAPLLRQGAVTRDGRGEAVIGVAMMGFGENSGAVALALQKAVDALGPSLPDGVTIDVFYDRTELVERTLGTVAWNLLEGGILVVAVLLLLLGNLRGGLLVASAIPLSMLFAVIGMTLAGVSGNLMSLGAIDFGLLVDGSVVMIDNVVRRMGEARHRGDAVSDHTVLAAAREVARPIASSIGIVALVYLPIVALGGIEGRMFRPMALTVVFALAGSLVVALVVMPVLATWSLRPPGGSDPETDTRLMRLAHRLYDPALRWALVRPRTVSLVAAGAFAASLLLVPFMGAVFVPRLDEGSIALQIVRPPSVSLEESIRQATEVERVLREQFPDEVTTVISRTGRAEIATDPMGVDFSDVYTMLAPADRWTRAGDQAELVELMQDELGRRVPGASFAFSQPIELRTNELIEGVRSDVALFLYGEDLAVLQDRGEAVARALRDVEGAEDVKVERLAGLPTLRIEVDREAIARLGLDAGDVLDAVEALGGRAAGSVLVGQRRFQLQVRWPEEVRGDPTAISRILVGRPGGPSVPLGEVARLEVEDGPLQVGRQDGQRRVLVELNVRGRDVATFVAEAEREVERQVDLPPGVLLDWGGQYENLRAATARLLLLVPLVLALIFGLLHASMGSLRLTLLVYTNVPFAVSGGIVALFLRGLPLSISAAVGFVALTGIAVMNGVVLLTSIRELDEHHERSASEAATEGASRRLRPVLMTALVAALGFVPMALSTTAGAEVQRPLATVVIGGLVTSTALTLLVLPSLYAWTMRRDRPPAPLPEPSAVPGPVHRRPFEPG